MKTNVLAGHTTVVLMLSVTTPRDPITALAWMDFMEME